MCVNGNPENLSGNVSGSTHLRAIELKYEDGIYQARKYTSKGKGSVGHFDWVDLTKNRDLGWWNLAPMQFIFTDMASLSLPETNPKHGANVNTLLACKAIASLMDKSIWDVDPNPQMQQKLETGCRCVPPSK